MSDEDLPTSTPTEKVYEQKVYDHKINPMFDEERKKHQAYVSGLEQQVLQVALRDPMKYMKHQSIGASYMSCSYNLQPGIDEEGDRIKAYKLLYTVRDYEITDDDLSKGEIELLNRIYGNDWRRKIDEL